VLSASSKIFWKHISNLDQNNLQVTWCWNAFISLPILDSWMTKILMQEWLVSCFSVLLVSMWWLWLYHLPVICYDRILLCSRNTLLPLRHGSWVWSWHTNTATFFRIMHLQTSSEALLARFENFVSRVWTSMTITDLLKLEFLKHYRIPCKFNP